MKNSALFSRSVRLLGAYLRGQRAEVNLRAQIGLDATISQLEEAEPYGKPTQKITAILLNTTLTMPTEKYS